MYNSSGKLPKNGKCGPIHVGGNKHGSFSNDFSIYKYGFLMIRTILPSTPILRHQAPISAHVRANNTAEYALLPPRFSRGALFVPSLGRQTVVGRIAST